jgi:hypothetical protein
MDVIDFRSLFGELGLDIKTHSGNLRCPHCARKAFKPYPDGRAHCHACAWHGDAIQLYADVKEIDRNQAYAKLAELYNLGKVKVKPKTRDEAMVGLACDLEYLAWCRMYFAFYQDSRAGISHYQKKSGYSQAQVSKILNGRFDQVSRKAWNSVVNMLRKDINVDALKRDIKEQTGYWRNRIEKDEVLRDSVSKHQ